MEIPAPQVVDALCKAKELVEQYHVNCHHPRTRRSVDDLEWLVREFCQRPVVYSQLRISAGQNSIPGLCVIYGDGRYEVYTLGGLNEDLRRLVASKELFHVVLDATASHSMGFVDHIREMQMDVPLKDGEEPSPAAISEWLAMIAAIEFLFPYEDRVNILLASNGNGVDYARVAYDYGLPQYYIEEYLAPEMMEQFQRLVEKGGW